MPTFQVFKVVRIKFFLWCWHVVSLGLLEKKGWLCSYLNTLPTTFVRNLCGKERRICTLIQVSLLGLFLHWQHGKKECSDWFPGRFVFCSTWPQWWTPPVSFTGLFVAVICLFSPLSFFFSLTKGEVTIGLYKARLSFRETKCSANKIQRKLSSTVSCLLN